MHFPIWLLLAIRNRNEPHPILNKDRVRCPQCLHAHSSWLHPLAIWNATKFIILVHFDSVFICNEAPTCESWRAFNVKGNVSERLSLYSSCSENSRSTSSERGGVLWACKSAIYSMQNIVLFFGGSLCWIKQVYHSKGGGENNGAARAFKAFYWR